MSRARSGGWVSIAEVERVDELPQALERLALRPGQPVLVLVGGAGGMSETHLEIMRGLLDAAVLPTLERHGAAVVDGGTDSGVMRVIGQARSAGGHHFPLVGVAAVGTVVTGASPPNPDAAALEPNHTQVVLVPGTEWGAESPWLGRVAEALADGMPTLTMVVNGGKITFDDVDASLARRRPVLVLAGTGRTADAIADARSGHDDADPRAVAIADSPLTTVVLVADFPGVAAMLEKLLARET